MKALVYHGPGSKSWEDVPDAAVVDPTDVVVRVDTTTICGTDLHILKGDVAAVTDGRVLGHEAVGTVTAGTSPLRMCRSVPQIVVASILTMASAGSLMLGSGTSSHTLRPGPW